LQEFRSCRIRWLLSGSVIRLLPSDEYSTHQLQAPQHSNPPTLQPSITPLHHSSLTPVLLQLLAYLKAFVLSFSEALAEELKESGVTVTALCPGPTATQFSKRAELEKSRLFKGGIVPVLDAATVAKIGYDGLSKGDPVVIPGLINKIGVFSVRLTPRKLVAQIAKHLNK
jgi:NAD(P)-dependent dehydrogenase (short-subunit alcohol dehydrogenase family)